MDQWSTIRRKAREHHLKAIERSNGDRRARALIQAALKLDDLEIRKVEPGTVAGEEVLGFLDRTSQLVNVVTGLNECEEAFVIGHEIGHYCLHTEPRTDVTVRTAGLGGDQLETGAACVEGYSPRERRELQADIFAAEFFCPADWLRSEWIATRRTPQHIADELGLPRSLVVNQLIRSILLPPLRPTVSSQAKSSTKLDNSQLTAAQWTEGSLLVDAGPGTGKTRTLIHRIDYLLKSGVAPASVLSLTFSNKAAEEMRDRLAQQNPTAAVEMWMGTFHAFGLELIRKWPSLTGRSGSVKILDQSASLDLLERHLAELPLRYYLNLYDPAIELVHVLKLISRCKDELVSPVDYLAAARADRGAAKTDEEIIAAEKAIEAGEIFEVYERLLIQENAFDFGDLVSCSVHLVQTNNDVREYIATFSHVLVDEYQDVNRASSELLKAIAGLGAQVWAVADERQSIYRFRGAEPSNVSKFAADFKGQRRQLSTNYRSLKSVVDTFSLYSKSMGKAGRLGATWDVHRGDGGSAMLTSSPTVYDEAMGIKERIEQYRSYGHSYSDQVILARTHLTLARITDALESLGVPMLYLGDLFERDEIRDLLSLLSLDAEYGGVGLMRVAQLAEYGVPREDVVAVTSYTKSHRASIIEILGNLEAVENLTPRGRQGLQKLGTELHGLRFASPWKMLTIWLFERSGYLQPLLNEDSPKTRQQLIAIYHLMKVCSEFGLKNGNRKEFLAHVRRLEALNQDTSFRAVASEATDLDAVRVMTIHASKGLEFPAVHIPGAAAQYFPANRQGVRCPPPPSLGHLIVDKDGHEAEEECLFFVALSRAQDHLSLSRADYYTSARKSGPSKFLQPIAKCVKEEKRPAVPRPVGSGTITSFGIPPSRPIYEERHLTGYLDCPIRYHYEVLEGLRGDRDESAYIQFHRCVYQTIHWIEEHRAKGRQISTSDALNQLATCWMKDGPVGHGFEGVYRSSAEAMVQAMVGVLDAGYAGRQEWTVRIGSRDVQVTPDRVLSEGSGTVRVQRLRTGRETKSEPDKPIYALLRAAAEATFPGQKVVVEVVYLATGVIVVVPDSGGDGVTPYIEAIEKIEQGAFPLAKERRSCPKCQCYFICGK